MKLLRDSLGNSLVETRHRQHPRGPAGVDISHDPRSRGRPSRMPASELISDRCCCCSSRIRPDLDCDHANARYASAARKCQRVGKEKKKKRKGWGRARGGGRKEGGENERKGGEEEGKEKKGGGGRKGEKGEGEKKGRIAFEPESEPSVPRILRMKKAARNNRHRVAAKSDARAALVANDQTLSRRGSSAPC